MPIFVQLDLAETGRAVGQPLGSGHLQLFYCTDDQCSADEPWAPFRDGKLVRIAVGEGGRVEAAPVAFAAKRIIGWNHVDDYPSLVEHEELGFDYSALAGDKLLGWPRWVQGVEYPNCPRCGTRMELLFQVDSNDHLEYSFGDMGTGHVTRCPVHPEVVAFGWACG